MNTTLLVLLVGELLAPFQAELQQALPLAFPQDTPEVARGPVAPPGRNVAWLTLSADGHQLDVVLHTAHVAGDLRRTLRFSPDDALRDRARAAAFTLAAMVRERDEDLRALRGLPRVAPPARPWLLDVSGHFGFDLPPAHLGGGGGVRLRRELTSFLALGPSVEVGAFTAPASTLVLPTLLLELAAQLRTGALTLALALGGGVSAPVLLRDGSAVTTWLPAARLTVEARWPLGERHGLRAAVSGQLTFFRLAVQVGAQPVGSVGAGWIRPEIGYFVEL